MLSEFPLLLLNESIGVLQKIEGNKTVWVHGDREYGRGNGTNFGGRIEMLGNEISGFREVTLCLAKFNL
jgi:hypothetical protein